VKLGVPVIVVGNISVGGTGKTPFTIWLVEQLRAQGLRPGVISRGYGGKAPRYPLRVTAETDPLQCGDEPALIARRCGVPVAVAPDRVAAAQMLIDSGEVDLLIADDGLQHYRLGRDLEVCVVDGQRGLGNGALLPAGPLREPPGRLSTVDLIVVNGGRWRPETATRARIVDLQLRSDEAVSLVDGERRPLADFRGSKVHAVAGIGHPARFFASLCNAGIEVSMHPFADHHRYVAAEVDFGGEAPVLMTEKDAVKCMAFAQPGWWCVPAQASIAGGDGALVQQLLRPLMARITRSQDGPI
jgi:tetraacyldisaccharide 4'-kinase